MLIAFIAQGELWKAYE